VQILQQWTEANAFLNWLRESSSIWAYPTVFFLHTAGLVFTAGASIIINMRLLGAAPELPIAPLARFYRPIWIGIWLTAISGLVMLASDLQTKLGNKVFTYKMTFVVIAVVLTVLMRRRIEFSEREMVASQVTVSTRVLAAASLLSWLGAVAAGKFMAYF
jgi:hypothetical protein